MLACAGDEWRGASPGDGERSDTTMPPSAQSEDAEMPVAGDNGVSSEGPSIRPDGSSRGESRSASCANLGRETGRLYAYSTNNIAGTWERSRNLSFP